MPINSMYPISAYGTIASPSLSKKIMPYSEWSTTLTNCTITNRKIVVAKLLLCRPHVGARSMSM